MTRTNRAAALAYLTTIHVALFGLIWNTGKVQQTVKRLSSPGTVVLADDPIIERLLSAHDQMDASVPAGASIFLGDSITQSLATAAVDSAAINYGIGWMRSDQLLASIPRYPSLRRAQRVYVTIGTNDILQGRVAQLPTTYRAILSSIPEGPSIIMSSPPAIGRIDFYGHRVSPQDARTAADFAAAACQAASRCTFVDAERLLAPIPGALQADGVHLTPTGYAVWIKALRDAKS